MTQLDNQKVFIYKLIIKIVATLLFSLKLLYLYVAYIIVAYIFHLTGFLAVLLIVLVWTSFNTLTDFVVCSIIETNKEDETNGEEL